MLAVCSFELSSIKVSKCAKIRNRYNQVPHLAVQWGCLRFVIVVFPDHTHLLFKKPMENMCFGCSKETSQRDCSFQHSWNKISLVHLFILQQISFLICQQNVCFGCSKEPCRRDCSFQHSTRIFKLLDGIRSQLLAKIIF